MGRGGDGAREVSRAGECRVLRARTGTLIIFHSELQTQSGGES